MVRKLRPQTGEVTYAATQLVRDRMRPEHGILDYRAFLYSERYRAVRKPQQVNLDSRVAPFSAQLLSRYCDGRCAQYFNIHFLCSDHALYLKCSLSHTPSLHV